MDNPSAAGIIYLLINPSLPNVVKIGKTTRTASERAIELSQATGVPTPFAVAYEARFTNCHIAEQMVHELLETQGYRTAANREFFSIAPTVGINAIITIQGIFKEATDELRAEAPGSWEAKLEPWLEFEEKASDYRYGTDFVMENISAAIDAYKTAIKLGSRKSYAELAGVYISEGLKNEGINVLLEGTEAGVSVCWLELALIYGGKNISLRSQFLHNENATRCFRNFFYIVEPESYQPSLHSLFAVMKIYIGSLASDVSQTDRKILSLFLPKFTAAIISRESPNDAQTAMLSELDSYIDTWMSYAKIQ